MFIDRHISASTAAGLFIIAVLVATCLLKCTALLCGDTGNLWIAPVAALLSAAFILTAFGNSRKAVAGIAAAIIGSACLIVVTALTEDYSFDGNTYHQDIVARIMWGWNPFLDAPEPGMSTWTAHYAKGVELTQAVTASLTGRIESGKAVNMMLIAATGLLCYGFLCRRFGNRGRLRLALLAVIAAANPVCIMQMFTFYIDYTKYCYLVIMLLLLSQICKRPSFPLYLLLTGVASMAILTKFNIFFETGLVFAAAIAWSLATRQRRTALHLCLAGIAAVIIGALVAGYHPYITNLISAGHPLYPLMGENAIDIMTNNKPPHLGSNRFINFAISLFYFEPLPSGATSLGGFTILMPLLLLLSAGIVLRHRRSIQPAEWYIAALTVASCFIFSESWWPRYIVQLWLIVPLAIYIALKYSSVSNRHPAGLLTAAGAACILYASASTAMRIYTFTSFREALYESLENPVRISRLTNSARRHLEERGIEYRVVPHDSLAGCDAIYFYGTTQFGLHFPIVSIRHDRMPLFANHPRGILRDYYKARIYSQSNTQEPDACTPQ